MLSVALIVCKCTLHGIVSSTVHSSYSSRVAKYLLKKFNFVALTKVFVHMSPQITYSYLKSQMLSMCVFILVRFNRIK